MRKFLLMSAVLLSSPAFAGNEAHTITIIHEDGSKDVIDLRGTRAVPTPAEERAPEVEHEPEEASAPEVPIAAPATGQASAPAPEKAVKKKAAAKKPKPKKVAAKPKPSIVKPPPLPPQREIPIGASEISRNAALSIALDYAPPATDMEVFRSEYEGAAVFAVMFKVEEGFHEVLVNAQNGKVLASRASEHFNAPTRPGHLPSKLR